jgi:hypothetical protein
VTDEDLAAAVAAAVATALGFPPGAPTQRVLDAAAAAVALVRWYIYGDVTTLPAPVLPSPVEAPEMFLGLQAFTVRIYHDPASPGGVVGGDAYTGASIPEDLLAHVHHYFGRYKSSWGIA